MKLETVLAIMKALGKTIPYDIELMERDSGKAYEYCSDSREEWFDILELDVIHAIRIIRKIGV